MKGDLNSEAWKAHPFKPEHCFFISWFYVYESQFLFLPFYW